LVIPAGSCRATVGRRQERGICVCLIEGRLPISRADRRHQRARRLASTARRWTPQWRVERRVGRRRRCSVFTTSRGTSACRGDRVSHTSACSSSRTGNRGKSFRAYCPRTSGPGGARRPAAAAGPPYRSPERPDGSGLAGRPGSDQSARRTPSGCPPVEAGVNVSTKPKITDRPRSAYPPLVGAISTSPTTDPNGKSGLRKVIRKVGRNPNGFERTGQHLFGPAEDGV
jgi:hypothetical protein